MEGKDPRQFFDSGVERPLVWEMTVPTRVGSREWTES